MRRLALLVGGMMAFCAALAENTYTWTGEAGVEGLWSVPANWSSKTSIPPEGHHWCFKDGAVVNIDGDHRAGRCYLSGTVKFVGNSTAHANYDHFDDIQLTVGGQATFGAYNSGKLGQGSYATDGASFSFRIEDLGTLILGNTAGHVTNLCITGGMCWQFGSSGETIKSGAFVQTGGFYTNNYSLTINAGARFVQSGGSMYLKKLAVSGGTLDLSGGTRSIGTLTLTDANLVLRDHWLQVPVKSLGSVASYEIEGDGGIEVVIPEGQAAGRTKILATKFGATLEDLPVRLSGACGGWKVLRVENYIFVTSGVELTTDNDFQWVGAVDDKWSTPGNWKCGLSPTNGNATYVYVGGENHPSITNDVAGGAYKQIKLIGGESAATSLPVSIRGEELSLYGSAAKSEVNSSIFTRSWYPLIFRSPVKSATDGDLYTYVWNATSGNEAGIVFLGGLTAKKFAMSGGPVSIGCEATCTSVVFDSDKSSNSRGNLKILDGGTLTVTEQKSAVGRPCTVEKGGHLIYGGTAFAWGQDYAHKIDGVLDVTAPYGGAIDQFFSGSGRVNLGTWKEATASYAFKLSESVHLYPSYWSTTCDGELVRTVNVTAGSPTLGATCDWTYGPDVATYPDATSAAADRAAVIATDATLIVDTEDPDTQAAHTITFADPFGGPGTLAKTGVGTLVLQTAATADETSLVLSEGVLELAAAQTFRTVTFEGGSLAFSGALAAAIEGAAGQWVEVLSAGALVGAPTADGDYRLKVETDEETGAVRLFAKAAAGMMILIK